MVEPEAVKTANNSFIFFNSMHNQLLDFIEFVHNYEPILWL